VKLFCTAGSARTLAQPTMIVDIPNLLSRAAHVMPLLPGDVYTTGGPAEVSPISIGDMVVVEGRGIGSMKLSVVERGG
jgi:2-keto-4-pentenoate hydratase/2-oxohepta-3-ene-1,7-dioic acid hydratase in catechol pathway